MPEEENRMKATKEAVIEAATQLERDGRAFYEQAAERASTEAVRKMFQSLANDEVKHEQWLKELAGARLSPTGESKALHDRLRTIFADVPTEERETIAGSTDDRKAIDVAITREIKAMQAYAQWAGECDDADVRALCLKLVDVETFHKRALENTIDYLDHTADWFMEEEQWSFDGG